MIAMPLKRVLRGVALGTPLIGCTVDAAANEECDAGCFSHVEASAASVMAEVGGELYVALRDGPDSGQRSCVWRWGADGRRYAVGTFDRAVLGLIEYGGELVAAGAFTQVNGQPADRLARLDVETSEWHSLGDDFPRTEPNKRWTYLRGLAVYQGDLIVAGRARIARWDGTEWQVIADAHGGDIQALAVWDDMLIVGGVMKCIDGVRVGGIAAWDGAHWDCMEGGATAYIKALATYRGHLIAAGFFSEIGGQPASRVARWDGASWHAMGLGMEAGPLSRCLDPTTDCRRQIMPGIWDLFVHNGRLYAGGQFTLKADPSAAFLAMWDGHEWRGVEQATMRIVRSLSAHQGQLVLGKRYRFEKDEPLEFLDVPSTAGPALASAATRTPAHTARRGVVPAAEENASLHIDDDVTGSEIVRARSIVSRYATVTPRRSDPPSHESGRDQSASATSIHEQDLESAGNSDLRQNAGPLSSSCGADNCGGRAGECWCDEACCERGDCCDDKVLHCGGCTSIAYGACPADLNKDGRVDTVDLLDLLLRWGPCGHGTTQICPGDLTFTGVVDVLDLLELLSNWGACP